MDVRIAGWVSVPDVGSDQSGGWHSVVVARQWGFTGLCVPSRDPVSDTAAGTISLVTSPCQFVSSSTMSKLRAIAWGVSTMIVVTGTLRTS